MRRHLRVPARNVKGRRRQKAPARLLYRSGLTDIELDELVKLAGLGRWAQAFERARVRIITTL
jgi:hypothetical protein